MNVLGIDETGACALAWRALAGETVGCPLHGHPLVVKLDFYWGFGKLRIECPDGGLTIAADTPEVRLEQPPWTSAQIAELRRIVTLANESAECPTPHCPADGAPLRVFEQVQPRVRELRHFLYCPLCGNEARLDFPLRRGALMSNIENRGKRFNAGED